MAKEQKTGVKVELLCIYSGDGEAWNPGTVIEVDEAEAARLIEMKAAVAVNASDKPETAAE